eukprot:Hpha_TRINITY_DN8501_c0_g1::TRINITY_DN8501_c0_g1_i1::g.146570::m.146570
MSLNLSEIRETARRDAEWHRGQISSGVSDSLKEIDTLLSTTKELMETRTHYAEVADKAERMFFQRAKELDAINAEVGTALKDLLGERENLTAETTSKLGLTAHTTFSP